MILRAFGLALAVIVLATHDGHAALSAAEKSSNDSLERGRYLVEAVAICFECHSERKFAEPGWPIQPRMKGAGRVLHFRPYLLVAPNITPDETTGIGRWTDREVEKAIREGIAPGGRHLDPEMPYQYYQALSQHDLSAIISYLRQIPPVRHRLPANLHRAKTEKLPRVGMEHIHSEQWPAEVKRGEYLVRTASCETCHTPRNEGGYVLGLDFAGGVPITYGTTVTTSSNITPDASGISYYNETMFISVMRSGRLGGRKISPAMPWYFYKDMSDSDLRATYAYLRAIPPVQHRVNTAFSAHHGISAKTVQAITIKPQ